VNDTLSAGNFQPVYVIRVQYFAQTFLHSSFHASS